MLAGAIQFAPEFGAVARNVERAAGFVREHRADLLVLPELITTGYRFADRGEALALAETVPDGPSTSTFLGLARETGAHLAFGIAERRGDRLYNTALLVGPEGVLLHYRKAHLFMREKEIFSPGDRGFPVVDLLAPPDGRESGGARVGMLVCFDYMFPEVARCLALQGAEVLLHPSNLITPYGHAAMSVRSLENGVYSILANRVGTESRGGGDPLVFTGGSRVIGPRGEVLAALGETEEGAALAEIEPSRAREKAVTPMNHLLRDRRPELYRLITDHPTGEEE